MNIRIKKHLLRFVALLSITGILYIVTFLFLKFWWPSLQNVTYPYLSLVVLIVVIIGIFYVSILKVTPQLFIQIVIAGTALKLLLFGVYIFFLLYNDLPHARANVFFFLIGYVLFTILEITSLYKVINTHTPTARDSRTHTN